MRVRIDFSVFSSPAQAYGVVTGYIHLESCPAIGDGIDLASAVGSQARRPIFFDGKFVVENSSYDEIRGLYLLDLAPVLLASTKDAEDLLAYCRENYGLMAVSYGDE